MYPYDILPGIDLYVICIGLAAVAAARQGLEVLLIEKSNSLGGALAGSLVFPFCPYRARSKAEK